MTPAEFKRGMDEITKLKSVGDVKREGMALIIKALGAGAPAYLDGLIVFMQRLEKEPLVYTPKEPLPPL